MKKIFFSLLFLSAMAVEAQTTIDAMRYSSTSLNGTARYRAMSGAFGALGGDLSSITINPAGSAVFLNSSSSITLDFRNQDNEVGYFGNYTNSDHSNVGVGQAGAVFVFDNWSQENDWRKFTLGFNYSTVHDHETEYAALGVSNTSIDQYFLNHANGIPLDLLVPLEGETVADLYSYLGTNEGFGAQQAFLGYESFVLEADNPDDFENTGYYSNIGPGDFNQEYNYTATGMNGKFAFNLATQYQDWLYLGLNLNAHFLNYEKVTRLFETNDNSGSQINEVYFEDRLETTGNGFSFQLGGIARLTNNLRMGLAYESPTWYTISEEGSQYLDTYDGQLDQVAVVDPQIVNVYPDYKLQTPGKYSGSLAYLFGPQGLISFDYSYRDYSNMKFKPTDDPTFANQNSQMADELRGASSFRLGGEYRFGELSLRGGYRFEESPYRNETSIGDLNGYSLGAGYDFGGLRVDLAYDLAEQERNPQMYQTGLTNTMAIDQQLSNVTLTLSFGI